VHIARNQFGGTPSTRPTETFTGPVWLSPVLSTPDGTTVNCVFFAPAARTHWHHHERGQLIQVMSGRGLICSDGGPLEAMQAGDVIWVPAGERHWHGGEADSFVVHVAASFGTTVWHEPVSDDQYRG
jgi:quercetin dioxygenase-like cupin family protein